MSAQCNGCGERKCIFNGPICEDCTEVLASGGRVVPAVPDEPEPDDADTTETAYPLAPPETDLRLSKEVAKICAEIPTRLNVVGVLRDAHERFVAAAPDAPPAVVAEKVVDVLREIATHAVEEFTRRTGQPFLWVDEPDPAEDPDNSIMSIGVEVKDGKGHVIF